MILLVILGNAKLNYRKSSINPPGGLFDLPGVYLFQAHLRRGGEGNLIETGCLFEKGGGAYLINKRPWYQLSIKKTRIQSEKG